MLGAYLYGYSNSSDTETLMQNPSGAVPLKHIHQEQE